MTRRNALLLALLFGVGGAMAQIPIEGISSHQPPEPPGFSIEPDLLRVTIDAAGTYVFRAKDPTSGALGQINKIHVSPAVTGTVTVGVYDWDTGPSAPGAKDVWEVSLAGATDGRLSTFRIAGNYGDSQHGGTMNAKRAETIHIGADVVVPPAVEKGIEIPQPVSGSVTIGGKIFSPVSYAGTKLAQDSGALPISTRDCVSAAQNGAAIGTAPALVQEFCGGVPTTSNPEETGEC